jgi:hypothetical protein
MRRSFVGRRRHRRALLLLAASLLPACAGAIKFHLQPHTQRCVSEHIPAKSLLTGEWELADPSSEGDDAEKQHQQQQQQHASSVEIRGPDGAAVFSKRDRDDGHFSITAAHEGMHQVCITSNATVTRQVVLHMKTALEVADHDNVAKKEHVEAIEAELDRMKKMAVHVYEEMLYMRTRSDQQHATNASTRGRLLWVEVVMMLAVLAMGFWQIRYLRNYFKQKKVI